MAKEEKPQPTPKLRLEQISTHWTSLHEPMKFTMTYAPAMRSYLFAFLRDEHEADEALQDLLLQMVQRGLAPATPVRGRFRDYLKAVLRNAARARLRRQSARPAQDDALDQRAAASSAVAEQAWRDEWRQCILNCAWRAIESHQRASTGNLSFTVLRLAVDHADEDSVQLAAHASAQSRQPLTPEAFRKQLSRARRLFAELIVAEVARTIEDPSDEQVREELAELNMLGYLRDYLPDGDA